RACARHRVAHVFDHTEDRRSERLERCIPVRADGEVAGLSLIALKPGDHFEAPTRLAGLSERYHHGVGMIGYVTFGEQRLSAVQRRRIDAKGAAQVASFIELEIAVAFPTGETRIAGTTGVAGRR